MLVDRGQLRGGNLGRPLFGWPRGRHAAGVRQLTLELRDALLLRELALQLGYAPFGVLRIHPQMIAPARARE